MSDKVDFWAGFEARLLALAARNDATREDCKVLLADLARMRSTHPGAGRVEQGVKMEGGRR